MLLQILDIRTCISLDRLPEPLQPTFPLLCLGRNLRNEKDICYVFMIASLFI